MSDEARQGPGERGLEGVLQAIPDSRWAAVRSGARQVGSFVTSGPGAMIGSAIIAVFILIAIFAPLVTPYGSTEVIRGNVLQPPGGDFWFGTDVNSMDVFSRTLHATRLDLAIALAAVTVSASIGVTLGLLAGYFKGWFDQVLLRTMDVLQAFPMLILGLAIVSATGQSLWSVVLVIGFLDMPIYLRLIRTETLRIRESTYVESAKAVGNPSWRILLRHILPNALPPVLIQTALRLAWAVKIIAALAFVGVGIRVPTAEWGSMIRVGSEFIITGQWWASVFPGLAVLILTFGFNILADSLQDHMGRSES